MKPHIMKEAVKRCCGKKSQGSGCMGEGANCTSSIPSCELMHNHQLQDWSGSRNHAN